MRPHGLPFTRQLRRGELVGVDTVVALILFGICLLAARETPLGAHPLREPLWASGAVALVMALPLAVRRMWPLTVCTVTLVAAAGALFSGIIPDYAAVPAAVTVAFAIYVVGLEVPARASNVAAFTCVGVLAGALLTASGSVPEGSDATSVTAAVLLIALGWLAGRATAERRANQARIAREQTARAVGEERLRIARELHDVVAHTMSLIAVKASVANHVADHRPAEARAALAVIEETSRTALADIRRVLGILRTGPAAAAASHDEEPGPGKPDEVELRKTDGAKHGKSDGAAHARTDRVGREQPNEVTSEETDRVIHGNTDESAQAKTGSVGRGNEVELAPAPGLADLPALVARTAAAGVDVDLSMPDADVSVPDGMGRTIYRIVQESLTNVVNHAGPAATCQARVTVDRTEVRVSIVDDGRREPVNPMHTGHGIVGMRERVAMYGGEFSAGPADNGGFAVRARLPLGLG